MTHHSHQRVAAKRKALLVLGSLLGSLLAPLPLQAGSADECRDTIHEEFAREQRLFRSILFGRKKAEDEPVGALRYDEFGVPWIKESEDAWVTSDPERQFTRDDESVDTFDESFDLDDLPRKGIFETKRVLTSELIPYLLEAMRVFDCRVRMICEVVRRSENESFQIFVDLGEVAPFGCVPKEQESFAACHLGAITENKTDQADLRAYCTDTGNQMVRREGDLLRLAVEYDAAYRSLAQFGGNFDTFLKEMEAPVIGTLMQAVNLMGNFQRIPCFLASCDSTPAPGP